MFKKISLLLTAIVLIALLTGAGLALEPQTIGPLSFYASQGDLEVVVKATHPGMATGKQPSVEWVACTDPSDGFSLLWTDPSPGEKWVVSEVIVSAVNEASLYKYDLSWGLVDNPSSFSVIPVECFKAEGGVPGDDDDDDDDIVTGWGVEVESCDLCGDDPEVDINPVDNPCDEDYFTFSFDIVNCENVCSVNVTFYLDCELLDDNEYGIWELVAEGDSCTPCEWEFLGGTFEKVNLGNECSPDYQCTLSWELTSADYDFCELGDIIFGVGAVTEPEEPEPVVISKDVDGTVVTITLIPCEVDGEIDTSFDITLIPIEELPDVGLDLAEVDSDDVVFFTFEGLDPTGICGISVCFDADEESCEDLTALGAFYFYEGIWTQIFSDCDDSGGVPVVCFYLDDPLLIQDLLGETGTIYGVGDTSIFVGVGDDDDDHDGGGGCNMGGFSAGLLLLAAPLMLLVRKMF